MQGSAVGITHACGIQGFAASLPRSSHNIHADDASCWPITATADLIRSRQALSEEVATGQASHTTITTADNPLIHSSNCSEPATDHHVGSLSTAYRTHRRRRGSQCHQQASFGTHPIGPGPRIQRLRASSAPSLASLLCPSLPSLQLNVWLTDWVIQRFASTSSSAEGAGSAWKNNALPAAATIFAVGSTAWYWQLYGRHADAMTPAEEG